MQYRNLAEVLRRQADRLGDCPALRYRRYGLYHDVSWSNYREAALACAAALIDFGIQPGDRVGLLAENRLEWLLADMGLLTAGAVNVPPHAPLTARQVQFQLDDADVRWVFVSTATQLEKIRAMLDELPKLEGVVVFEDIPNDGGEWPRVEVHAWRSFLQHGRRLIPRLLPEIERRERLLGPDDLATIMYTSGTTGNPKGVMLTHGNLVSNACASIEVGSMEPGKVVLNWLPFSHIYARTVDHYQTLIAGVVLCLAESADTLIQDLADIQPTHMASVPRFYEKVLTAYATTDSAETSRKLKEIFGPRIHWLSSGGAPLPVPIAEVFLAAGLPLYQGYGLTETSPVISFNRPGQNKIGTVGRALPGVEIAIGPDGEVLTRGPHVMKGYWKNPQATAETIVDGWLHTGDLGEMDSEGYLRITGRKKELMVLSNGKKVVPTYLEGLLLADDCIDQAVVHGEGKNFLTALIVPHWENVRKTLKAEAVKTEELSDSDLASHPVVLALLRRRIDTALADVSSWEQIKKFIVLSKPFTVANDELTVSLKLRRNVVLAKHAAALEALYRE